MSTDKYPSIFSRQMATIVYIFPNFQNCARCEKDLKDNKDNSRHLGRKYARIFVLGRYLFLVAHSFPRASLSENCSLLGTDNVPGQISEHIFAPNDDYCLYSHYFSSHLQDLASLKLIIWNKSVYPRTLINSSKHVL